MPRPEAVGGLTHNSWKVHKAIGLTHHFLCTQAAIQQCQGLRLLELLTHISWKVDGPCPLKTPETIITHLFKQLPSLKACSLAQLLACSIRHRIHCIPCMMDSPVWNASYSIGHDQRFSSGLARRWCSSGRRCSPSRQMVRASTIVQ